MPRDWHDRHAVNTIEDEAKKRFYRSIVADKKPYFMRYIYPALMKQYNTYIRNTNKRALREFQLTVNELKEIPEAERTAEQKDFLRYYRSGMPVGDHDCVMNRICRRFEREFDGYLGRHNRNTDFDYTIMKSGAEYSKSQFTAVQRLYESYSKRLRSYAAFANLERIDECETYYCMAEMREEFTRECAKVCPDRRALCDIVLDICYTRNSTKRFAWEICGSEIIQNLLDRNGRVISVPVVDAEGEIYFGGERFSIVQTEIGGDL